MNRESPCFSCGECQTFDTSIKKIVFSSKSGIIAKAMSIPVLGGGTDLRLPFVEMLQYNIRADRLIMISDNEINSAWRWSGYTQTCQSQADQYRAKINKDLWVHAIDLMGYGTQQFIGGKTNIIAGWNEKVLEFIALAEEGIETQVKRIEEYT